MATYQQLCEENLQITRHTGEFLVMLYVNHETSYFPEAKGKQFLGSLIKYYQCENNREEVILVSSSSWIVEKEDKNVRGKLIACKS